MTEINEMSKPQDVLDDLARPLADLVDAALEAIKTGNLSPKTIQAREDEFYKGSVAIFNAFSLMPIRPLPPVQLTPERGLREGARQALLSPHTLQSLAELGLREGARQALRPPQSSAERALTEGAKQIQPQKLAPESVAPEGSKPGEKR